ncbi:MAG: hypothetical protein ACWGHH_06525 [Sulfurovaceae bacterium]
MAIPMNVAKEFLVAERSAGKVLASASAFMVVEGFEELSFLVSTQALPMLKNNVIEYSTPTGMKTSIASKNQTLNDIALSFNERESHIVKKDLERILMSGKNGNLNVAFYTGDGEKISSKLWGTIILGKFIVEDTPEVDSEGSETPLKVNCRLVGHYFPEDCSEDLATRGIANTALNKIKNLTPADC